MLATTELGNFSPTVSLKVRVLYKVSPGRACEDSSRDWDVFFQGPRFYPLRII